MLQNKKLVVIVGALVAILALGGVYTMLLAPAPAKAKPMKITGTLVPLSDAFTVNLAGGHYGRVSVSLLMTTAPAPTLDSSGANVIVLPENDVVRAIITNDLTGINPNTLIEKAPRQQLLAQILHDIKTKTDEPVTQVLFTDLAVQ